MNGAVYSYKLPCCLACYNNNILNYKGFILVVGLIFNVINNSGLMMFGGDILAMVVSKNNSAISRAFF